ncbi:MAG: DUF362 domain-containing protein [Bryobacteraceae bacterium]
MRNRVDRRGALLTMAGAAGLASCGGSGETARWRGGKRTVAVLRAPSYEADLTDILWRGAQLCGLEARGKRVLLKPNFVEFDAGTCINTNMAVVAAAYELFRKLGAAEVWIGEGPGHRRDTLYLAEEAGYFRAVKDFESRFVDLNRDEVAAVPGFLDDHEEMYFSKTLLAADLIVSLPKMKTHHWAGATLSMKNFFGLVPGAVYGWPKNPLHYQGIDASIVGLSRKFRNTFAIVDGIVGMEGNGPIQGRAKPCGVVVMGGNLPAVDATCSRVMGLDPEKIRYLAMAADIGPISEIEIEQRGESPKSVMTPFAVTSNFESLRMGRES